MRALQFPRNRSLSLVTAFLFMVGSACNTESRDTTYQDDADLGVLVDLKVERKPPELGPPPYLSAPDVHVVITADNAYAFG